MRKIGEVYVAFFKECKYLKACAVLLRGGSKDVLNEIERNLMDVMQVVRNVLFDPRLLPGGGATEMAVSAGLRRAGLQVEGIRQGPFLFVGKAMDVILRTLAQNCGGSVIHTVTHCGPSMLRSTMMLMEMMMIRLVFPKCHWGIDGTTGVLGVLVDMAST